MASLVTVDGVDYPVVSEDEMTWDELEDVEAAMGVPLAEIRRRGEKCLCGHKVKLHEPKASRGGKVGETPCQACEDGECDEFVSPPPLKLTVAYLWISMRRQDPSLAFEQVSGRPIAAFDFKDEAVGPDPTEASGSPTSRPATSDRLPKRSASSPGNGTA